jgi:uncharacterized membrane protein YgaE (UPF0421/DUF939 family)
MGMAFGLVLIVVIVIAFFVNFVNFRKRTERELSRYRSDVDSAMERLKKEQMSREDEQALIHKQTYIISQAEQSIRRLEDRMIDLESLAERAEALMERYRRME